jgi:beta-N-acetylhexosaminidase
MEQQVNPQARPGPVLIGLSGLELTAAEIDQLQHPLTGGVVLFTRNYTSPEQLQELTAAIRTAARAHMLVCVDHEGGRVQRFREGFTRLPALAVLGRMYADSPDHACDFAYRHARVMASELLVRGVDLSFAPVLDLDRASCVIGDRAFAAEAGPVCAMAGHYLAGMHDSGMRTCGKHFPGHGSVLADSHVDDVLDQRPYAEIEASDLVPFRALLQQLDSLMLAHVVYPAVDEQPAGYSDQWINHILRRKLGYRGVVLSDDLGMHAALVAGNLVERMRASLQAGCDAVLVCQPEQVAELYAQCTEEDAQLGNGPVLQELAGKALVSAEELPQVGEWRHWKKSLEELEHSKWA